MKILTILVGAVLAALGVFSIANGGLAFSAVAFPIAVVLMIVGFIECMAYKKTAETEENKHWILIDGFTTFILGFIVITGYLTIDAGVIAAFAMWCTLSGIRVVALIIETKEYRSQEKNLGFICRSAIGILNLVIGIYAFYNTVGFNLSVLSLLGICFIVQGINVVRIGCEIPYFKPELIKSRKEKIADATAEVEKAKAEMKEARQEAKEAILKVKEANEAVKEAEEAVKEAKEAPEFLEIISEPVAEPISDLMNDAGSDNSEKEEADK